MSDNVLVNVKLDPEKKERWDRAVEDNDEYSSLSHLIRMSVSRELAGMYEPDEEIIKQGGVDEDVRGQLNEIQAKLETMEQQMGVVEANALSSADIMEVADSLYDLIPEFSVVERDSERVPVDELDEDEIPEGVRESLPDEGRLEKVELSPEYEFGEIEPSADGLSQSDRTRVLTHAMELVDGIDVSDVSDFEREIGELEDSELRRLTETGMLTVYREYLEVQDYEIRQAAQKLADEYPNVKLDTGAEYEILYEVNRS